MSSRAPNAPPTPPSVSRTLSGSRSRHAAICLRSSCSHCVATNSSIAVPAGIGHRQRCLQTEERLILHADLVRALDDHLADHRLVAADDALMADDVAGRMDRRMTAVDRPLGIGEWRQHLVLDDDRRQRPPARLGMIGGDRRDRLADEADDVAGEDRLIAADQAVRRLAGHVVGGDDRCDAVDAPRRRRRRCARSARSGWGERNVAPHRNPSADRSPENANEPCTLATPSGRAMLSPSRPAATRFARVVMVIAGSRSRDSDALHGLDDPPVAGATTDVARQLLANLDLARVAACGRAGRAQP